MFEFENFQDRDACRDFVAKILGRQQGDTLLGQASMAGMAKSSSAEPRLDMEQLDRKEMDRRMKLLSEDSELQTLHRQLVIKGVLTEAEFWAARKCSICLMMKHLISQGKGQV